MHCIDAVISYYSVYTILAISRDLFRSSVLFGQFILCLKMSSSALKFKRLSPKIIPFCCIIPMAFEDMLQNWEKLITTAKEESTEVDVDRQAAVATGKSLGFSLIGKLFAPRIISGDVMRRTFKSAWNIPKGLIVEKVGANLFLFSLRTEADQSRVLRQGPWLFDKFLLALSKPIPMVKPTTMEFKFVAFWVHFCELPMDLYNQSMAECLGNAIGHFLEYDNGSRGYGWKKSLRVHVTLDIMRPLRRGIKVRLDEPLGSIWTPIKYKKMPEICGYCGRIGHGTKDCSSIFLADGPSSRQPEYGMWMAFNGRSSSVYRSPSTSPFGKKHLVLASSPNHNPFVSNPQVADSLTSFNQIGRSPTTSSGNRPMDISPAMEETVTISVSDNLKPITALNLDINEADVSRVKKLEYGLESFNFEADRKGKAIVTDSNHGVPVNSNGGVMKQPDIPAPSFSVVASGSVQNTVDSSAGFYSLSGWADGSNRLTGSQLELLGSRLNTE